MKKSFSKSKILILSSGFILPTFLIVLSLSVPRVLAEDPVLRIVFVVKDQNYTQPIIDEYHLDLKPVFISKQGDFSLVYHSNVSESLYNKLKNDPRVSYAELDLPVMASLVTPDDSYFTTDSTQEDKQWYLAKVKVPDAWDYSKGTGNVTVAIIDTGIHATHVELNDGRVIDGFNILTSQAIPANTNSDDNGHGTAVAGVIGAIPNNNRGIAGINWSIKLMPVKALSADGTGDISDVSAAIVWATDHGANIINLSMGGPGFGHDQTLINAITYAYNKGAFIVAAAGNDQADSGLNLDTSPVYPICADNGQNMITGVAATDVNDHKTDFSNFGANCIDISAPGKKILTTAFLPSDPSDNLLIYGSGTSLAAPIVSGVAALIKSNNINLSNVDIRNILLRTADKIDSLNQNNCLGANCAGLLGTGRINALTALTPPPITNSSVVRDGATGNLYFVNNGLKSPISSFVFSQRKFDPTGIINDNSNQLAKYNLGTALLPLDGTLIKNQSEPLVYVINQGFKRPLTYLVFVSRGFSFANIVTLSETEVASYPLGDWYWPPDGTMVLIKGNPLVYVMDQSVVRPITYFVFTQRKYSFAKVISVTLDEFSHVPPAPDYYWMPPLDGTLIKSDTNSTVYVIEGQARHLVSYPAFIARGYKFSNVKTLPQVEIDIVAPGDPILK